MKSKKLESNKYEPCHISKGLKHAVKKIMCTSIRTASVCMQRDTIKIDDNIFSKSPNPAAILCIFEEPLRWVEIRKIDRDN